MIKLRRLNNSIFALNSDLIELVEETPDTVITLVDGKKYVVRDTIDEILEKIAKHNGRGLYWYRRMLREEARKECRSRGIPDSGGPPVTGNSENR